MLVNGKEERASTIDQDRLGAVAVMHVKVKHRNLLRAGRQRFERGDGDRVEVAKAHGVVPGGVVPRRTQKAEGRFPVAGRPQGLQRAAGGAGRMIKNSGMRRRVAIEIGRGALHTVDVLAGMGALEVSLGHRQRLRPRNPQLGLAL